VPHRLAAVLDDDDLDVLVLPRPPHAAQDQNEQEQHRQADPDRHPFAHRPEPGERPHSEQHHEGAAEAHRQQRHPPGEILQLDG
jgi:hypothetical protein